MPVLTNHDIVANPGVLGRPPEVVALEAKQGQQALLARLVRLEAGQPTAEVAG